MNYSDIFQRNLKWSLKTIPCIKVENASKALILNVSAALLYWMVKKNNSQSVNNF